METTEEKRIEDQKALEKFISRPELLEGTTVKIQMACGSLYVTVNTEEGAPKEVFSYFGHSGSCLFVHLSALCKLASVALQAGVPAETVIRCLREHQCQGSTWNNGDFLKSCPDAIGQYMEKVYVKGQETELKKGKQLCLATR
jgi:ribonucleoside-diphosphate reductase alpha chain